MSMWSPQANNLQGASNESKDAAASDAALTPDRANASSVETAQVDARGIVHIGHSIAIKGELIGGEDLTLGGQFEGRIELAGHALTIGPGARVVAELFAGAVIVLGQVTGNIKAADLIAIRDKGSVEGDLVAPRVAIAEGTTFNGRIVMQPGRPEKADAQQTADAPKKADVLATRSLTRPVSQADSKVSTAAS